MFCPNCNCEYRKGFTVCADCEVALVAALPSNHGQETGTETSRATLIPVFETYKNEDIIVIKSELDAAKVIYHFSGENFHMIGIRPIPARLLVASDRTKDVLAILRDLKFIQ